MNGGHPPNKHGFDTFGVHRTRLRWTQICRRLLELLSLEQSRLVPPSHRLQNKRLKHPVVSFADGLVLRALIASGFSSVENGRNVLTHSHVARIHVLHRPALSVFRG